ncbi:hypothetical protein MJT46_001177 [Ovis ammon polii x Ovis aries]|nr:hypothetical protein MJT46_001177 [Ovis ammon polii x Ovis aries]
MNGIFEMLEALLHVTGNSIEMAVTGPEVSFPFSCGKATLANFNGKGTLGWNIKVNTVLTGSPEDQAQGKDQNPRRPTGSTDASPPQDLLGYEPPLLTQWCQGAYKDKENRRAERANGKNVVGVEGETLMEEVLHTFAFSLILSDAASLAPVSGYDYKADVLDLTSLQFSQFTSKSCRAFDKGFLESAIASSILVQSPVISSLSPC